MSHALMEEATLATQPVVRSDSATPETAIRSRWVPALVLLGVIAVAISVYAYFWQHSRELWWSMGHDRHTHYMNGLNIAFDIKTGDLARLWHDIDRIRVWGVLHPILVALVEMIAGPDHRLAVLPSLAGWILTMWCAYLLPRRLLPEGGNYAGLVAAFLVAVSPAHRAYATDVMYDSLGAGLSLTVFYFYATTLQERTRKHAIWLGITLSALFLHKTNYWVIVCLGLIAGEFLRQPKAWMQFGIDLCRRDRLPSWLHAELKQPLNYVAIAFAGAALYVAVTGGSVVTLVGRSVSITEPHNLVHAAYIAVFLRGAWWWYKNGRAWSLELPITCRQVLLWHGGVVALWFLMPKRLSYFLWYMGPGNNDQATVHSPSFMDGVNFYLRGIQEDYLTLPWGLYLMAGLLMLALVSCPKLRPGTVGLFCFLLIAMVLTCRHPMHKHRFVHTWIAASYVLAATGAVFAVQQAATLLSRNARPWAAGLCTAILIGLHIPGLFEPAYSQEGGLKPREASPLKITDTYLPALADARNPTIVGNVSTRFLWTWTFIEHHKHQNMAGEIKNFKTFEDNPDVARRWLETTRSDALVLIDVRRFTTYDWKTSEYVDLKAFHEALASQKTWVQSQRWDMPEGVTITLWKKPSNPGMSAAIPGGRTE